jgi:hypothetical protein
MNIGCIHRNVASLAELNSGETFVARRFFRGAASSAALEATNMEFDQQ